MFDFLIFYQDTKKDNIEIVMDQKKELRLIDKQRAIRGLILWEYNMITKRLTTAKFKESLLSIKSLKSIPVLHKKVIVNENCYYFQALNRANAGRKITELWGN